MSGLPRGPRVPAAEVSAPTGEALSGRYVRLRPVDPDADLEPLFHGSHGSGEREALWTYLWDGPFADRADMRRWLEERVSSREPTFYTVESAELEGPVGMASFLNIVASQRTIEVGHIWYVPEAQRTRVNTESVYLLLAEAFDLGYRRVEWKCDALNERSRRAALRLGFRFEGVFRQHLIIKGRNRDTAWYSMIDSEWQVARARLERWLYENEDGELSLSRETGSS